jgi:acyl transferase domain-containing protein
MLDNSHQIDPADIAIVGMALRVPGARNVNEFWQNLRNGVESIRTLSPEELIKAGEADTRVHYPNYVPRTADLPDMEMFDADFFGLSPKEAAIMDPQHRQFLECAWEAMEDAGRTGDADDGLVGVFAGSGMGSYFYFNVCSNRQLLDQVGMFLLRHTGNDKDFLATRASFSLNLRGPSVNIQTACSTSLVATHYACQSLLNGECDMALAGGVTIELPHRRGYLYQNGEILSPDGHCRAFDHRAAGTVFGSGVGVVALRRLADAIKDGDVVHAVIKATAVNNDGASKAGYLAPSVTGQAEAIIEALGLAGISAETIQYVECHGTGTPLGDPIEIEALTQAFRQSTDRRAFCRVGSVKSNIGHLDTAAGVVGLIKATLSIKHGEIPPTLGFEKPNPAIDFAASPFLVNDRLVEWPAVSGPRRAAVNSLGVGGTNAHAILEQAPRQSQQRLATKDEPLLLLLSARQRPALSQAAAGLAATLRERPDLALDDVAHTLHSGRKHFEHRLVLAARDRSDAIEMLSDPQTRRAFVHSPLEATSGAVFLFPGGGAQHPGMAKVLYSEDEDFRASVDEGLSYLPKEAEAEIRSTWLDASTDASAAARAFLRPSVQLPAILIVEVAISRLWMRWGIQPSALIGHSMGENAAACVAGVMSLRDAVGLVRLRGELFEQVEAGGMLSVPLDPEAISKLLPPELDIASINAPELCVISGSNGHLESFGKVLTERGVDASRIPIDIAAHSRMLEPILARFEAFLRTISLSPPSIPIVSNKSGEWLTPQEAVDPLYWVSHLRSTVQFAKGMSRLSSDPARAYIEVGPGRTLSSLVKAQGNINANQVINSLPHAADEWDDRLHYLSSLGRAWAIGLPVDLGRLFKSRAPQRVPLPTYPFQHRRYFIEPAAASARPSMDDVVLVKEADIAGWGYRPAWKQTVADHVVGAEGKPTTWLFFVDEGGEGRQLVERLRLNGHRVVSVSLGDTFIRRDSDDYVLCAEMGRAGYDALFSSLADDNALPSRIVHMWLVTRGESFRPGSNFFHKNQECGFYSVLYLAQTLGETASGADLHITVVTNGMQRVFDEVVLCPEKATVLGPGLVLPGEIAGVTVRLIDIDLPTTPADPLPLSERLRLALSLPAKTRPRSTSFDLLWEDLFAAPVSETVAYRKGRRWSRVHERLPLDNPSGGAEMFRRGGVYFFTGGLGDLARVIATELAKRFDAKLVLTGRTELPPRKEWQAYVRMHGHDAVRRAISAILALEEAGAEVLYLTADVTNPQAMGDAVATALSHFGRIDGVFHTAGVVDDDLMQAKTEDRIERVLAPKALGTTVLDTALENVALDFLVLFSSTSTDTAPTGQADYVAANAYLNAYAESRSARADRKTVAVHWGIWNEVGIAARASNIMPDGDPISMTAPAAGPFFESWIEDGAGVPWLEAAVSPQSHWILDEHRLVSGAPVMPGTGYIEMIAQAAKEYGLPFATSVEGLSFLRPLLIADGNTSKLRVRFEPVGDGYRVTIVAADQDGGDSSFERHAEAILKPLPPMQPQPLDTAPIAKRCDRARRADGGSALRTAQEDHIRFGSRWSVLKSVALGHGEALAELELNGAYHGDLSGGVLVHPALLDIATGFAIELTREYDPAAVLWAPVAYERILLHRPLPTKIVSWARLNDASEFGDGYAAFDVTIADTAGNIVFEATRFVMKRLNDDVSFASDAGRFHSPATGSGRGRIAPPAAVQKLAAQVRQGILPAEGFEALLRALATSEIQPIVSSINLEAEPRADVDRTLDRRE